jgi:DNA-binding NarL/FixJ family response regulator
MSAGTVLALRPGREPRVDDERVRVLIADHDGLARRMIGNALQQASKVVMVAAARNGQEALELSCYYRPEVLILDTALPPDGCVKLTRQVLAVAPHTRVLTLSADDDQSALAALRAGAVGHISKDIDPAELVRLVLLAEAGEAIVPRRLVMSLLQGLREVPDSGWRPLRSRLTTREWEIIELLNDNTSTEHIAQHLVLSPTTVYSHIKNVLRKLGVHTRHDAIAAAEQLRRDEALGDNTPPPHPATTNTTSSPLRSLPSDR